MQHWGAFGLEDLEAVSLVPNTFFTSVHSLSRGKTRLYTQQHHLDIKTPASKSLMFSIQNTSTSRPLHLLSTPHKAPVSTLDLVPGPRTTRKNKKDPTPLRAPAAAGTITLAPSPSDPTDCKGSRAMETDARGGKAAFGMDDGADDPTRSRWLFCPCNSFLSRVVGPR